MAGRLPSGATTRSRRALGAAALAAAATLALPAAAAAHGRFTEALDFRSRVAGAVPAGIAGARVVDGARRVQLTVAAGHTAVVLGYGGEPLLRIGSAGVDVNDRSPTATALRLARAGARPALAAGAAPVWRRVAAGARYTWHDDRVGPRPGHAYGDGEQAAWILPLRVDGSPGSIGGHLVHSAGPPLWPWLAGLAAVLALATAAAARPAALRTPVVAPAAAVVAVGAALATSLALGLASGRPSGPAWVSAAISIALAAAALGGIVLWPRGRAVVAGAAGIFSALAGLGHVAVLTHAYAVAILPAAVVRASVAVSVAAGLLAAAALVSIPWRPAPAARRRAVRAR